ncbi:MAG: phosphoribosylformylglycinamidine synthase I [Candidatus Gracilibacteria bacterium]
MTNSSQPSVLVLAGYGINCEEETKFISEKVGAKASVVHINDLIANPKQMEAHQIMVFPGGFSYGDDVGSGIAYANKVKNNIWDDVVKFVKEDKLVLGICNGCQIMANLGLVPGFNGEYGKREIALCWNASARYECRWVDMKTVSQKCVWMKGIERLHCPISHGEGRFYMEKEVLEALKAGDQIVTQYVKPDGSPAKGEFPYNPNGAMEDIAGVCDPTGRVLALMPHPERNWNFYNEDDWTLLREQADRDGEKLPEEGPGVQIFRNAVEYFK